MEHHKSEYIGSPRCKTDAVHPFTETRQRTTDPNPRNAPVRIRGASTPSGVMDIVRANIKRFLGKFHVTRKNLLNRNRLKTAFKIWLFFAILKAIAVVCVWFGVTSLLYQGHGLFSVTSIDAEVTGPRSELAVGNLTNSTLRLCHLAGWLVEESRKHSTDGATALGFSRHHLRGWQISKSEVQQFIGWDRLLETVITDLDGNSDGQKLDSSVFSHNERLRMLSESLVSAKHVTPPRGATGSKRLQSHKRPSPYPWQKWHKTITNRRLYDGSSTTDDLLRYLTSGPISSVQDHSTASQIVLLITLRDGSQAVFKPMRVGRSQERNPNVFFWHDVERHHAEIAAFHLDRILEFYRVPPTAGRFINITADIQPFAPKQFADTIYISPVGNKCFYGNCDRHCDASHPVCGDVKHRDVIEGSMTAWIPLEHKALKIRRWEYPWRQERSRQSRADWQISKRYCERIQRQPPYDDGTRLLDMIDISVFDFLINNQGRQSYYTIKAFGNHSSPILYDNGLGFGLIQTDDSSILAPVEQCCLIRKSTLRKLIRLASKPNALSIEMRQSLIQDPLSYGSNGPLLTADGLVALDRRLEAILDTVLKCVQSRDASHVIIDDGL